MEEILQVVLEIVFQVVFEVLVAGIGRTLPPSGKLVLKGQFYTLVGGLLGWSTILLFPHSFVTNAVGRVVYLAVVPVVIGFLMSRIGQAMVVRGKKRTSLESFGFGWLFAFAFALARFIATR